MRVSRRNLLKAVLAAPGSRLLPAVAVVPLGTLQGTIRDAHGRGSDHAAAPSETFFTQGEAAFIDAAVARIIPNDELGPGAKEAGVPDSSTASSPAPTGAPRPGTCRAPGRKGTEQQGYQLELDAGAALSRGDRRHRRARRSEQSRQALRRSSTPATQDALLHALDGRRARAARTSHGEDVLRVAACRTRMEGFLADPMYGGNRDFAGWKLIGFPGPRYNYVERDRAVRQGATTCRS